MATGNAITIVGNLTDDPELKFTGSGAAVVNFTVAVNGRKKNGDQWEDVLEGFFRCNAWRALAENIAETCTKGMRVIVCGKLNQRTWETKEGDKRYAVEIQADEVAPSLKWATATVERTSRSDGNRDSGGGDWGGQQADPPPAPEPDSGSDWGHPAP